MDYSEITDNISNYIFGISIKQGDFIINEPYSNIGELIYISKDARDIKIDKNKKVFQYKYNRVANKKIVDFLCKELCIFKTPLEWNQNLHVSGEFKDQKMNYYKWLNCVLKYNSITTFPNKLNLKNLEELKQLKLKINDDNNLDIKIQTELANDIYDVIQYDILPPPVNAINFQTTLKDSILELNFTMLISLLYKNISANKVQSILNRLENIKNDYLIKKSSLLSENDRNIISNQINKFEKINLELTQEYELKNKIISELIKTTVNYCEFWEKHINIIKIKI